MDAHPRPSRVAIVAHPARALDAPMKRLERWAGQNGLEIVQIATPGSAERQLAQAGVLEPGDLVVALGGDGTVLSALHASAPVGSAVMGVACGSVGALAAVTDDALDDALDRVLAGDWTPRRLPALSIEMPNGEREWAVNDFVGVRRGAGQLVANLTVDDELYVRMAGDGVIVATALGSSAYSMAAGGPLLAAGTPAFVCTPLAMHGGNAPPLIVAATSTLHVQLHPGFAGFDIEIDGHNHPARDLDYAITLKDAKVTLVSLHDRTSLGLTGLREKHLITDSARILARDARADQVN